MMKVLRTILEFNVLFTGIFVSVFWLHHYSDEASSKALDNSFV